jgi:hypothetical protein
MKHITMTGKAVLNLFQISLGLAISLNKNNKLEELKKNIQMRLIKLFKRYRYRK